MRGLVLLLLALIFGLAKGHGRDPPSKTRPPNPLGSRGDRHPHELPRRDERSYLVEVQKRQLECSTDQDCVTWAGTVCCNGYCTFLPGPEPSQCCGGQIIAHAAVCCDDRFWCPPLFTCNRGMGFQDEECVALAAETSLSSISMTSASFVSVVSVSVISNYKLSEPPTASPKPTHDDDPDYISPGAIAGSVIGGMFLGIFIGMWISICNCRNSEEKNLYYASADQYSMAPVATPQHQPTPDSEQHRFPEGGYGADGGGRRYAGP